MSGKKRAQHPDPTLVTTTEALAAACLRLRQEPYVTVDTEFVRDKTYWPELCVVQLGGAEEVLVVDTLAPGLDLAPLGELLADPAVIKVFHAARQDIKYSCCAMATPPPAVRHPGGGDGRGLRRPGRL